MSGAFYDIKGIVIPPSGSFRWAYHVTFFLPVLWISVREAREGKEGGGAVGLLNSSLMNLSLFSNCFDILKLTSENIFKEHNVSMPSDCKSTTDQLNIVMS